MSIRLSPHFVIAGAATLILCSGAGVVLGGFAAGGGLEARHASLDAGLDNSRADSGADSGNTDDASSASDGAYAAANPTGDAMIEPVICTGCGPTLAERRAMGEMQGLTDGAMTPDAYGHDEQAIEEDVARNMRDYSPAVATPPTTPHSRVSTLEGANGEGAPAASESVMQAGY